MSIAVLGQVYDEAKRLAAAGSVVAHGDFRLKKLLPPLDQAGAKAPVFAKVAESARAVIDGTEATSAESLLELTSLVSAVLYTQGETGVAGPLEPIVTTDLGGTMTQTSARLLKPVIESLKSTGSGRLEILRDAHARGAFRDIRLIKPALDGLDDSYAEIGEFLEQNVIAGYGRPVWDELQSQYDPKGTRGNPRRLRLMHKHDAERTRALVKEALEVGSKEVKVAAIECLTGSAEDLSYLIEQASAKAQDVRGAAYRALATIDDPQAVAVLEKAINGKDVSLAANAIRRGESDRLANLLVAEIVKARVELPALKDKKKVSESADRMVQLVHALPTREHAATEALLMDLFSERDKLAKAKGDTHSGSDVVEAVIVRMVNGNARLRTTLAHAHAEVETNSLPAAFEAARRALPATGVFDLFSPYLVADDKKKGAGSKREAILRSLGALHSNWYWYRGEEYPPLDPRWLDLAVKIKHVGLVQAVARPGHAAADAFALAEFEANLKKAKSAESLPVTVLTLVRLKHPKAAECLIATVEKSLGKASAQDYWYIQMVRELPSTAIPLLEALVPKLKDQMADRWLSAIQDLRDKS